MEISCIMQKKIFIYSKINVFLFVRLFALCIIIFHTCHTFSCFSNKIYINMSVFWMLGLR